MSNYNFATVPKAEIQRSSFDRSHNWKGTFNAGLLIPFYWDEIYPADTFNLSVNMLVRLSTPIVPIMDNLYIDTFFFFVPDRLIWNNFEKLMGAREDPDDSNDFLTPLTFTENTEVEVNSVMDYLGFPLGNIYGVGGTTNNKLNCHSLVLRAYELIWNEWFRSEFLQDSIKINKTDSAGYTTDTSSLPNGLFHKSGSCLPRGKRHDYFTSSNPWPAAFGQTVDIPLGTEAPVITNVLHHNVDQYNLGSNPLTWFDTQNGTKFEPSDITNVVIRTPNGQTGSGSYLPQVGDLYNIAPDNLVADLTQATAATINTLRQAFQIQRMLERDARGGVCRYTEILRNHFNTVSPDARLQRPEYLGGSSNPFLINPVAQTASTDNTTPQGNLAAFGIAAPSFHGFTKSFVEHGFVIGLCCVRADLNYQQGLNRMLFRRTRYDFYWPTLAHLGEQVVFNKEIYAQGTSDDDEPFGYQERYAELRYHPNVITGEFRSTAPAPLDAWHLAQKFDSLPTLSDAFIRENPPVDRVVAVPSEPQFIMDAYFKLNCVRPMPLYGVPGLIDHF